MSLVTEEYFKAKQLGEKLGWDSEEIYREADNAVRHRVMEMTRDLVDAFNSTGSHETIILGMLDGITKSHRFLQSEFWAGMICLMARYGDLPEHCFDARNEVYQRVTKRMARVAHDPDYDNQ